MHSCIPISTTHSLPISNQLTGFHQRRTTPAYALLATQQITAPSHSGRPTPDFVGILMILVRLAQQQTDIVIMVNVPHVAGEYLADQVDFAAARLGPLMQKGVEIRDKILETFDIKDWELFVNE